MAIISSGSLVPDRSSPWRCSYPWRPSGPAGVPKPRQRRLPLLQPRPRRPPLKPPPPPLPNPPPCRPWPTRIAISILAVTPLPQDTFFPWLATSSGHLPFRPMWENLTTISPETGVSTILPQLAREWDVSPDASEYTFRLQEGVQMHNGWGEFTVKDVVLTIDQQMSDPLAGCKSPLKRFMGTDSMTEMIENGAPRLSTTTPSR